MAVKIRINGVDRSAQIDFQSIIWTDELTSQVDTLEFMVRNVASKTYRPALNDDVKLYDDSTVLFGGVVTESQETIDGLTKYFRVVCKDYVELLDRQLVAKSYTAQTATAIITDIISTYAGYNSNLNTNGDMETAPTFVAAQTATARWVDGSAAGAAAIQPCNVYGVLSGSATCRFDSGNAQAGSQGFKIALVGGGYAECTFGGTGLHTASGTPVSANTTYQYSYYMKSESVTGASGSGQHLQLSFSDISGVLTSDNFGFADDSQTEYNNVSEFSGNTVVAINKVWTRYTGTFTTGATTRFVHPIMRAYGHTGAATLAGNFFFDNVYIVTNAQAAGFTVANVVAPYTVATITFNYLSISQALQKLAEALPSYDWYVDGNRDINFFAQGTRSAPYVIDDTTGNFDWSTLKFEVQTSQLRNIITVRGGNVNGTSVENQQKADGVQRNFFVGYNLGTFLAYKALAAAPTSFSALTVGADGKDDPTTKNCLYNPDRGLLIFPEATKPAIGDVIKFSGVPSFPLFSQVQDPVSVATYGKYEYLILDKTITTKDQAIDRAQAELAKYAYPLYTGSFSTNTAGLKTGQVITITSVKRSISGTYKLLRVRNSLRLPSTSSWNIEAEFSSTFDIDLVDILNKLLIKDPSDQIVIGSNEIIDRIFGIAETITIGESTVQSLVHNPQTETITLTEATNQALNAGTIFVIGAYTPSGFADTKRVFVLDGALLG